jgi:DNA-binding GntR family transcriptional regulator
MTSQSSSSAWDRLQTLLLTIEPNQTITLDDVVTDTGLSPEMVRMVLNGLAAAGLFEEPEPNVFVRRSLFQHSITRLALA